ncbi:putative succinyl-CoA transferase [Virgisporangium aliadipatigenens]|uniref:Putative succinyl-CoA transferase n=1 Tax=Virgisporangium aliadipatigenens TaxID=741659 RepID=A0A8J4DTK6_9ACTN|nr:GNAT family protein [Virgisporangium aliadipatigenens]GIJ50290.1 putative succinyl-CoA transferase [Virgisporangium aliadipatigenens]
MVTPAQLWPPFALSVHCGHIRLSAVTDADIGPLAALALGGVHEPGRMPFAFPWTEAPKEELPSRMAAYYWRKRATFSPEEWTLDLVVRVDGEIVGVQGFSAKDYAVVRTGETGSWLGQRFQGKGIGTAMRRTVCALFFDHLGAAEITSAAFLDNPASLAVSRKVGYVDNGTSRWRRRPGELAMLRRLVLTPERFVRPEHPLTVEGITEVRAAIGL